MEFCYGPILPSDEKAIEVEYSSVLITDDSYLELVDQLSNGDSEVYLSVEVIDNGSLKGHVMIYDNREDTMHQLVDNGSYVLAKPGDDFKSVVETWYKGVRYDHIRNH